MQSTFWLNDPTILFNKDKIGEIWPTQRMSSDDKLNAVTRLVIILTILGYLVTNNMRVGITGIVTIIAIIILRTVKGGNVGTPHKNISEGFANLTSKELDEIKFTRPKEKNPMMNVLLPQIQDEPNRPSAAPAFNPTVVNEINATTQEMVVNNFDDKTGIDERLFRDLGDSFNFDRSMIHFNATANTQIPNDQKSFAEFCYGDMISCKEGNSIACTNSMPPHRINGTN
ncbi:MAG: hypothetical protein CMI79_03645 [Candidatus Pelagibacter sp.]|nr:hypothetical protein [Candidatus Pelagibacter sp.]|tara:strand:- start:1867 stop:2550 length:684 start_codon:yes stop_codon:yes gene_type:complete